MNRNLSKLKEGKTNFSNVSVQFDTKTSMILLREFEVFRLGVRKTLNNADKGRKITFRCNARLAL